MRIKVLTSWPIGEGLPFPERLDWKGVEFCTDQDCREYDWLVVYDEFPRDHEREVLACPPSHTILVTQEPPSIKIYNPVYTHQFQYVLTTHDPDVFKHPHFRRGAGCLIWLNGRSIEENCACPEFEKTDVISAICSAKQYKHTEHFKRYSMVEYLSKNIPGFEWRGGGVRLVDRKVDIMDSFKYHVVIENYIHPYHWTEKLADAYLSLCLPFYAGDSAIGQVLPPDSFIPIPLDDPPEAARIIREAIETDQYAKRLPAIREARRLIVERYNLWSQVLEVVAEHEQNRFGEPPEELVPGAKIKGRRKLRRNPINALRGAWYYMMTRLRMRKQG